MSSEGVRVDKWLWAVRLFKTRTAANDACESGRVSIDGDVVKAARRVRVGDRVHVRRTDRETVVEVVGLLEKRVSAPKAAEAYIDHSPPPPPRVDDLFGTPLSGVRDRGTGRPTKRDRRQLDRLRDRRG
ncbi:MAG: RNA-binding S4 domain-containing protein [Actinomycetota bacterium]|nr:RNA-binding S4 domain-containing protein [Actinomycetota bacterium]